MMADDHDVLLRIEFLLPRRHLVHRNRRAALDPRRLVLPRLTHVQQHEPLPALAQLLHLLRIDLVFQSLSFVSFVRTFPVLRREAFLFQYPKSAAAAYACFFTPSSSTRHAPSWFMYARRSSTPYTQRCAQLSKSCFVLLCS